MAYKTCLCFLMMLLMGICLDTSLAHAQPKRAPIKSINDITLPPVKDIPAEFITEMDNFYEECMADPFNSGHRDCQCYSMSFLQERLLMPSVSQATILNMISQDCYDQTSTAGYYYRVCFNMNVKSDIRDWETICSCFGNQMAKLIERQNRLDFVKLSQLQTTAYVTCGY